VTKPVRTQNIAEAEIRAEIRWYENERTGLGDRLWSEIQDVTALIADHPKVGSTVPSTKGSVRRFPLGRFPFFLVYREREDHIEIIALAHSRREPNYWRSRLTD